MDTKYYIYKHTSPSGKSYIGQTNNIDRRALEHRFACTSTAFRNAIIKYGWDKFRHEILYVCFDIDESNRAEQLFILEHNSLAPLGYNLRSGGLGHVCSLETRKRISDAKKGKPLSDRHRQRLSEVRMGMQQSDETKQKRRLSNLGKERTDKFKQLMSLLHKGKVLSDETKQKLSDANKGKVLSDETKQKISDTMTGKQKQPLSDDTKQKISIANTGKKLSDETKQKMSDSRRGKKRGPYKKSN